MQLNMNLKQKSISFEWHAVEYELKTSVAFSLNFIVWIQRLTYIVIKLQTFGGVTDKLNQQSGGLFTSLATGLANLNGGLAAKFAAAKQTAAQFLATGQEALASLHHKGTDVLRKQILKCFKKTDCVLCCNKFRVPDN